MAPGVDARPAPEEISAEVRVLMGGPGEAEIVRRAISVGERPGSRSSVGIRTQKDEVILTAKADDVGALRATLNSLLREVKIADDAITLASKTK
jgi:tRNA threonylcarbamoyladenosine modification (KEOPS) complex  Pcc1 subunit